MRVNHAGEIAAQALYHGQALVARSAATRDLLMQAAREEGDHLAWCETRLPSSAHDRASSIRSGTRAPSRSARRGAGSGDRVSLGFVTETERQVEGHLDEHLARFRRATAAAGHLETMRAEEIAHGAAAQPRAARAAGAVRALMATARVMTGTATGLSRTSAKASLAV